MFRLSTNRPLGGRRCSEIDLEEALQNYFLDIYRFNGRGSVEQIPSCPGADWNPSPVTNRSCVPTNAWEENFVNYMLYSDIVVIEQSPPRLESVINLAKRGSGIAIGAYTVNTYTGMDIGDGNTLLLLISVSTGIVIGGASVGVTRGLEVALENKIVDLFNEEKSRRR